jgi:hypothetical protein
MLTHRRQVWLGPTIMGLALCLSLGGLLGGIQHSNEGLHYASNLAPLARLNRAGIAQLKSPSLPFSPSAATPSAAAVSPALTWTRGLDETSPPRPPNTPSLTRLSDRAPPVS